MTSYFAYVRVSTTRQGEGASLAEQRFAIERYAASHHLPISQWFEEMETAARRGRPVFKSLLGQLADRGASGLLIHKIDRSARNLRDWADLGELIDAGVDVRFAHDNLDLDTRGGRLAADIQAVIAADYIRNLSEEVKKGLYGRLRQGLYPFAAPLGYLDRGPGRLKVLDPATAPLIADAFERFATGAYSKGALLRHLRAQGLRNRGGSLLTYSSLNLILTNRFYVGQMQLRIEPTIYRGIHRPLVSESLFDQVQAVLESHLPAKRVRARNHFTYRRLLRCQVCGYFLVGELKKGHVYYRCHKCRGANLREELIEDAIASRLSGISLPLELGLADILEDLRGRWCADAVFRSAGNAPSPRLRASLSKASSVQQEVDERTQAFLAFASRPSTVFEHAPALQRRELCQVMLQIGTRQRDIAVSLNAAFRTQKFES